MKSFYRLCDIPNKIMTLKDLTIIY